jgi:hypothetical protein
MRRHHGIYLNPKDWHYSTKKKWKEFFEITAALALVGTFGYALYYFGSVLEPMAKYGEIQYNVIINESYKSSWTEDCRSYRGYGIWTDYQVFHKAKYNVVIETHYESGDVFRTKLNDKAIYDQFNIGDTIPFTNK